MNYLIGIVFDKIFDFNFCNINLIKLLIRWLPVDGCIELTGGVPEKVKNLPGLLALDDNGKAADRLFFDLVRASQLGNLILAQAPRHVNKGDRHNHLRLSEARQLGLEVSYVYR